MISEQITRLVVELYQDPQTCQSLLAKYRRAAPKRLTWWQDVLTKIRVSLPHVTTRDFTSLKDDVCFGCQVTLVAPDEYDGDDIALTHRIGGRLKLARGFASILGPYAYVHAYEMSVPPRSDSPRFADVAPGGDADVDGVCNTIRDVLAVEGYNVLSAEEAKRIVPVETECTKLGETMVFHCLFADSDGP